MGLCDGRVGSAHWWSGGSKEGACIFDSGTGSHAGLTEREKMDREWMESYLYPGAIAKFHIYNICIVKFCANVQR